MAQHAMAKKTHVLAGSTAPKFDPAAGIVVIERGGMSDLTLGGMPRFATQTPIAEIGAALNYLRARDLPDNPNGRQLWIRDADSLIRTSDALERARRAGWDIRPTIGVTDPQQDAWLLAYKVNEWLDGGYHLVFPALNRKAPWRHARDAGELASALRAYARALGMPFYRSPQATGARLMRSLHAGEHATRLTPPVNMPPPAEKRNARLIQDSPLMWRTATTRDALTARPWFISFDVNAQFLRATNGLAVGFGEPVHLTGAGAGHYLSTLWMQGKTRIVPGYWRIRQDPKSHARDLPFPHPLYRRGYADRPFSEQGCWVTTPTIKLLYELGMGLIVEEAWMWTQTHRVFDPWYTQISKARTTLMGDPSHAGQLALATLKETYTMFIGALNMAKREDDNPLKQPPWRHHVISEARAGHYRNAINAPVERGYLPLLVTEDTAGFLVETSDPMQAAAAMGIRLGDAPGQYKIKDCLCVADWPDVEAALLDTRGGVHELQTLLADVRRQQGAAEEVPASEDESADEEGE